MIVSVCWEMGHDGVLPLSPPGARGVLYFRGHPLNLQCLPAVFSGALSGMYGGACLGDILRGGVGPRWQNLGRCRQNFPLCEPQAQLRDRRAAESSTPNRPDLCEVAISRSLDNPLPTATAAARRQLAPAVAHRRDAVRDDWHCACTQGLGRLVVVEWQLLTSCDGLQVRTGNLNEVKE